MEDLDQAPHKNSGRFVLLFSFLIIKNALTRDEGYNVPKRQKKKKNINRKYAEKSMAKKRKGKTDKQKYTNQHPQIQQHARTQTQTGSNLRYVTPAPHLALIVLLMKVQTLK